MSFNSNIMEYEKFILYLYKKPFNGKRRVVGQYRDKGSEKVYKEELMVLNIRNSAEESYKGCLAYFNHTRDDPTFEKERVFVSAQWSKKD